MDVYCKMLREAKLFRRSGRSRFRVRGPFRDGLNEYYEVQTADVFADGETFLTLCESIELGKQEVARKALRHFDYPNPYEIKWKDGRFRWN